MKSLKTIEWSRVLKCGISLGVYLATRSRVFVLRLFGIRTAGSCVILNYHSITADQREAFARQLDILRRHATPVRVDRELTSEPGKKTAAITFDDGFEDFLLQALPELRTRNIPSTVFVIVKAVGQEFGTTERLDRVMSVQQLRALPEDLVTIGSHTLTHPFLPETTKTEAYQEIVESRKELEKMLGRPIELFSFPFGGFTQALVDICREAGYRRVFTTLPTLAVNSREGFAVGRVRADTTDWPLETHLKIAGAYRWLPLAFELKRRILDIKVFRMGSGRWLPSVRRKIPYALIRYSTNDSAD
jgi:peptidoglycan/xylan/chitin deacetylase (PgdA/CDA1 family)